MSSHSFWLYSILVIHLNIILFNLLNITQMNYMHVDTKRAKDRKTDGSREGRREEKEGGG